MSTSTNKSEFIVTKKIRVQMVIIAIIILLSIAILFAYFFSTNQLQYKPYIKQMLYKTALHDKTANIGIGNYFWTTRHTVLGRHKGIIFDSATIYRYLTETYGKIKARHTAKQMQTGVDIGVEGYIWKIGFYWLVKEDTTGSKNTYALSYYVVPLLVHKDTNEVLDYFDTGNDRYYAHPTVRVGKGGEDQYNVYDEGQLWP